MDPQGELRIRHTAMAPKSKGRPSITFSPRQLTKTDPDGQTPLV